MDYSSKIKSKLFPDDNDVLYYGEVSHQKIVSDEIPYFKKYTPVAFSETEIIANDLRNKIDVHVDISKLDKSNAMRMIDFLAGVMFALDGDMDRKTKHEFVFSVSNKKVSK